MARDPEGKTRARIVDVAQVSGYSPSVVSRVLAGKGDVTIQTRTQILAAAHELGYERHGEFRGRPSVPPKLIDLTFLYFDNPWTAQVIAGAWKAASALGFDILLTTERDDENADWVRRTQSRGVAGAIICQIRPTSEELRLLARSRIPIVLLDPRSDTSEAVPTVGTDDRQGGFDAGEHLAGTSATRFYGLVGTPQYRFGRARMDGFVEAINTFRPEAPVEILQIPWSHWHATQAVLPLLKATTEPIGIFASNDAMATGVYYAAAQAGKAIPADVHVVGFDDEPTSRLLSPPLTTLKYPLREAAATAVNLIADSARGVPVPAERIEVPSQLIVRGSTHIEASA
ncbi:LacI family DNA-binding transcriptional regulator [Leifsonia sp. 2MCAF36]|uniref:LacI family DNA-binding transcriptional regulator n=1 Tax=Leifsonia sp. 2MCAF36 TaxID=3232988 RepID=UPI003F9BA36A